MIVTLALLLSLIAPALAAETINLERMATCQDSWLDWKNDPARMQAYAENLRSAYVQRPREPFFVPKTKMTLAGLPVVQVYPGTVGMGVGFSVAVEAPFDKTRQVAEQLIGKSLKNCDTSDNMRSCELQLGDKKNVMLIADASGKSKTTLLGCYYYYEK